MFSSIISIRLPCFHHSFQVLYVQNPVRGRSIGMPVLNVQMNSVEVSKRLRDLYSGFFRHNRPAPLPPAFKGVTVRNKVTLATRIRIAIMQELGANYKESNPGSSINLRGYGSRPLLTTTPARGAPGRPRTYTFIDAVTTLPPVFSDDALANIFQRVGQHHPGELREVFVVLDDDDRDRCAALVQAKQQARRQPAASSGPGAVPSAAASFAGSFAAPGAGMELEAGFLASIRAPPPPPPPCSPPSSPARAKDSSQGTDNGRDRSPSRKRHPSKSRSHKVDKSSKGHKSGRSKSGKTDKSRRSDKRGFKRNRHTPPPGEKLRKKARPYSSSSSSSSGSSDASGSGSDSGTSSSSGSGHRSRKRGDDPEH